MDEDLVEKNDAASRKSITLPAWVPDDSTNKQWRERLSKELELFPDDRILSDRVLEFHDERLAPIVTDFLTFRNNEKVVRSLRAELRRICGGQLPLPDEDDFVPQDVEAELLDELDSRIRAAKKNTVQAIFMSIGKVIVETALAFIFVHQAIVALGDVLPSGDGARQAVNVIGLVIAFILVSVVQSVITFWVTLANRLFRQATSNALIRSSSNESSTVILRAGAIAINSASNVNEAGLRFFFVIVTSMVLGIAVSWFWVDFNTFRDYLKSDDVARAMAATVTLVLVSVGIVASQKQIDGNMKADAARLWAVDVRAKIDRKLGDLKECLHALQDPDGLADDWKFVVEKRKDWAYREYRILLNEIPDCASPRKRRELMDRLSNYFHIS
ncbi:MAG: hypothetical protein RLY39_801 [Actinomycetota bacterium]|jgi:hypothetical protein